MNVYAQHSSYINNRLDFGMHDSCTGLHAAANPGVVGSSYSSGVGGKCGRSIVGALAITTF